MPPIVSQEFSLIPEFHLPIEVMQHILTLLDGQSLARVRSMNKMWLAADRAYATADPQHRERQLDGPLQRSLQHALRVLTTRGHGRPFEDDVGSYCRSDWQAYLELRPGTASCAGHHYTIRMSPSHNPNDFVAWVVDGPYYEEKAYSGTTEWSHKDVLRIIIQAPDNYGQCQVYPCTKWLNERHVYTKHINGHIMPL